MDWKASVLVVANVTAASDDLLAALETRARTGPAEFTLIVPPAGLGAEPRRRARERLETALERLRGAGLEARGELADPDPVVAVHEAWDPGRYDEIVVSTLPTSASRWLMIDLPRRVERITGAPVTHVVSKPPPKPHATSPAPERRRPGGILTPLEVLGWGGAKGSEQPPVRRS